MRGGGLGQRQGDRGGGGGGGGRQEGLRLGDVAHVLHALEEGRKGEGRVGRTTDIMLKKIWQIAIEYK